MSEFSSLKKRLHLQFKKVFLLNFILKAFQIENTKTPSKKAYDLIDDPASVFRDKTFFDN